MKAELQLVFSRTLPTKPGFYWYTNFGEHTPVVLQVTRDHSSGKLWAQNEEFCFQVRAVNVEKNKAECQKLEMEPVDGFYHGEELWAYIPNPWLPNKKKQVTPDSY